MKITIVENSDFQQVLRMELTEAQVKLLVDHSFADKHTMLHACLLMDVGLDHCRIFGVNDEYSGDMWITTSEFCERFYLMLESA